MPSRTFAQVNKESKTKSKSRTPKQKEVKEKVKSKQTKATKKSLSTFFGGGASEPPGPVTAFGERVRGFTNVESLPKEFPNGKADIWSWNINGSQATTTKGTL